MAHPHQIDSTLHSLGSLWSTEHAENDPDGVAQIERLVALLKKFKKHEQQEHKTNPDADIREATYQLDDGRSVYYDDGRETLRDAADLYTVLAENHETGSPNLENGQARMLLDKIQQGGVLGEMHIGTLRKLLAKHSAAIAKLRKSRDRDGQDLLDVASEGPDSRIANPTE